MINDVTPLPRGLAALAGGELLPGEKIVWTGQPVPARYVRRKRRVVWMGVYVMGFSLFWIVGAFTFQTQYFGQPDGVPLLFGLAMLAFSVWLLRSPGRMRRDAEQTAYVLTTQRALILEQGAAQDKVRTFELARLQGVLRVDGKKGAGDLILDPDWAKDGDKGRMATDTGFVAIENVKAVEELVRSTGGDNKGVI